MQPILALLTQGITPEKIALSLAIGIAVGVFPMLGTTTLLCAGLAIVLGLNLPAMQLVNYLVYPAQIALLIPFMRLGEWIFSAQPLPLSLSQILAMVKADAMHAIAELWHSTMLAVVGWSLTAPVFVLCFYFLMTPLLRRLARRSSSRAATLKGVSSAP